ncbi:MAG: porin, partial [Methylocystis sp.]|nr:porin [Methylocystis sp.]
MIWRQLLFVTAASLAASAAFAADLGGKKGPAAPPPPPPRWIDTVTLDGFVEGGVAINFNQPFNRINWGHLYTCLLYT